MKNFIKVTTLIFVFLLSNCSKDSPNEPKTVNKADEIWPLAVGNLWDFSSGMGITVFSRSTCAGNNVFNVRLYTSNGNINNIGDFTNLSDGLYTAVSDSLFLFLKYPGSTGERFNVDGNNYWEIVTTSKTVSVTAGEFEDCYEYSYYVENNPVQTFTFKPNVGLLYLDDGSQLVSYTLK